MFFAIANIRNKMEWCQVCDSSGPKAEKYNFPTVGDTFIGFLQGYYHVYQVLEGGLLVYRRCQTTMPAEMLTNIR